MLKLVSDQSFCDESKKAPGRKSNADIGRVREYLTSDEIQALQLSVKTNRHALRDRLLIMVAYKHGLRVSELVDLKWEQVDFKNGVIAIKRSKNGTASTHKLSGDETRLLRELRKQTNGAFLFVSERGEVMQRFAVNKMLATAGIKAGFAFPVHPHMLRHAAGFQLAKAKQSTRQIQGFLGHKNIQHTVKYTALDPDAYKGFEDIIK